MTLEQANIILKATDEMSGNEIALLALIKDLQVRHVTAIAECVAMIEKLGETSRSCSLLQREIELLAIRMQEAEDQIDWINRRLSP